MISLLVSYSFLFFFCYFMYKWICWHTPRHLSQVCDDFDAKLVAINVSYISYSRLQCKFSVERSVIIVYLAAFSRMKCPQSNRRQTLIAFSSFFVCSIRTLISH